VAVVRDMFARRQYVLLVAGLTLAFAALYTFFDFREGMRESSLTTTRLATVEGYLKNFGGPWFYGNIVFNIPLALVSSTLVGLTIFAARSGRMMSTGAACSVGGTTLFGFACFGCPGCYMPLAGSLGIAFFTKSMPLLGLEFKALSLVIALATLVWLTRRLTVADQGGLQPQARLTAAAH
jgi:hypothetical protein